MYVNGKHLPDTSQRKQKRKTNGKNRISKNIQNEKKAVKFNRSNKHRLYLCDIENLTQKKVNAMLILSGELYFVLGHFTRAFPCGALCVTFIVSVVCLFNLNSVHNRQHAFAFRETRTYA